MSVDFKLIGGRIQAKRKEKKITQEKLAERLSVTVGYISQIERGITKVNIETLAEICEILGCDVSFVLSGVITDRNYLEEEVSKKFSLLDNKQKRVVLALIEALSKYE